MNWVGKVGGGLLGFLAGGPIGAAVGTLLGHQFDRGLGNTRPGGRRGRSSRLSAAARRQIFFETTFRVMGHLAKADGRVSEEEIQAARTVMHRMRLRPEAVRLAIELFTAGKQPGFRLDQQLSEFRAACGGHAELQRTFLEIQMDMALSKGSIKPRERELLWRIASSLGVGRVELAQIEAVLRAQRSFGGGANRAAAGAGEISQAYRALGIESSASDRDVKMAYRRLMNEHHPDKLVARGLPDSMMEVAKNRTYEIRAAYELIKKQRQMK